ncbi:WhiB family transcriptional regulator, partial [Corynebacterium sp. A21]|uniref:WhiB family transcriptional regulator n=1 Tax=Corynebacterium sp. A21 TaxID=3457318 RepID=UPI003FD11C9F
MTASLYLNQHRALPIWRAAARASNQDDLSPREVLIAQAKCRQGDPDDLFVRGAAQRRAAVICRHCPVRTQCLVTA